MKLTYCKICGDAIGNFRIVSHLSAKHHVGAKQYYDTYFKKPLEEKCKTCGKPTNFISISRGYREFCSRTCARKDQNKVLENPLVWRCEDCGIVLQEFTQVKYINAVNRHIENDHKMTPQEYYDKYLKKEGDGICHFCGNQTRFKNIFDGYNKFCNLTCHINQGKKDTEENKIEVDRLRKEKRAEKFKEIRETKQEIKENRENFEKQEQSKDPWIAKGFEASPIYFQHFETDVDWS